jgi:vanillate O-demethylase monooxygenase subunit
MSKAIGSRTFTSQAVTPLGNKKSRYFFSWGPHRDHGDEKLRDFLMSLARQAFAEDKNMIEAQQAVIDATAEPSVMPTVHDRGVTMFQLLTEKMVRDEATQRTRAA